MSILDGCTCGSTATMLPACPLHPQPAVVQCRPVGATPDTPSLAVLVAIHAPAGEVPVCAVCQSVNATMVCEVCRLRAENAALRERVATAKREVYETGYRDGESSRSADYMAALNEADLIPDGCEASPMDVIRLWRESLAAAKREAVREWIEGLSPDVAVGIARFVDKARPRPATLPECGSLMQQALLNALTEQP